MAAGNSNASVPPDGEEFPPNAKTKNEGKSGHGIRDLEIRRVGGPAK